MFAYQVGIKHAEPNIGQYYFDYKISYCKVSFFAKKMIDFK